MRLWIFAFAVLVGLGPQASAQPKEGNNSSFLHLGTFLSHWQIQSGPDQYSNFFVDTEGIGLVKNDSFAVLRGRFPASFSDRLQNERFAQGVLPNNFHRWIGWFQFDAEPTSIHLIGEPVYSRVNAEFRSTVKTVSLGKQGQAFGFLVAMPGEAWMFVLSRGAIKRISLAPEDFGESETLIAAEGQLESAWLPRANGSLYDRVLDVDGDGMDDILICGPTFLDVYRQDGKQRLSEPNRINFNSTQLFRTGFSFDRFTGFPYRNVLWPEIWMEPAIGSDFPSLALWPNGDDVFFCAQFEPGRFDKPKNHLWFPLYRETKPCSLSRKRREGLLSIEMNYMGPAFNATIGWKNPSYQSEPLNLDGLVIPPQIVDLNRDGVPELFILKMKGLKRALEAARVSGYTEAPLLGEVLVWHDRYKRWAQMVPPFSVNLAVPTKLRNASDVLVAMQSLQDLIDVDRDLDGDGVGDLVWMGSGGKIHILLMSSRGNQLSVKRQWTIEGPKTGAKLHTVDLDGDHVFEVLVEVPAVRPRADCSPTPLAHYYVVRLPAQEERKKP